MALSTRPCFHYVDLQEGQIRLVDLQPGLNGELPKVSLRDAVDSLAPPPYEGLSYTWEDETRTKPLQCGGSVLYITPSLYTALYYLRRDTNPRTLWVDQICMNQESDPEKSSQIPLMPRIFSNAKRVLVWLGEENSETKLVFEHIQKLASSARELQTVGRLDASQGKLTQQDILNLQLGPPTAPEWVAYRNLLQRSWFSRVWTYEEIVLSRDAQMRCGYIDGSWNDFAATYALLTFASNSLPGHQSYLIDDKGILTFMLLGSRLTHAGNNELQTDTTSGYSLLKPSHDLLNLVKMLRVNGTRHPRDKIYGVLGVAKDLNEWTPKVDVSVDFRKIYCDFTKWFIRRYNDLSVLKLIDIIDEVDEQRENPANLPSWVPDFRYRNYMNNMPVEEGPKLLRHGSARMYNATGASEANTVIEDANQLTLRGISIGKIVKITKAAGNLINSIAIGPRVLTGGEWFQMAAEHFQSGVYGRTNETIEFAYARTRTWDHLPGEKAISDRQNRVHLMRQQNNPIGLLEPGPVTFDATVDAILHAGAGDISRTILTYTTRRKFYITDTGYMGICHRSCQKGDYVYLLLGGDMPFVLRKCNLDRFCFKGESYVHGVMDGELWSETVKQMEKSEKEMEWTKSTTTDMNALAANMDKIVLV